MIFVIFIVANLLLMAALFAYGVYQFMQVEEKRKGGILLRQAGVDLDELQTLVAEDRYDEALRRLMHEADVDRFTAEAALAQWTDSAGGNRGY